MGERAVRTRREPLGAQAGSPPSPLGSRNTAFPVQRPSDISSGANEASTTGFHESRDTNHGFYAFHETRITVSLVPLGTEALQSCFFRPGLLGKSTRRRRETVPAGRESRLPQAFTSRKPLILRFLRDKKHGCIHETRVTKHEARFCVFHESRNTSHETRLFSWSLWCSLVLKPFSLFFGRGLV